MSLLAPEADRAVRHAVDAFLSGSLRPSMLGETLFETRNGRYRLMDGVLFAANDTTMVGAELVGWLLEGPERSIVQDGWIVGARAVMVDRRKSRHIIVTSTTKVFKIDATGSGARYAPQPPHTEREPRGRAGSVHNHGSHGYQAMPASEPRASLPPPSLPPPSSTHGPLTPRRTIPACPPAPIGRLPGTTELSQATATIPREPSHHGPSPLPMPPPSPRPTVRVATPVHAPPRRTGQHPRVSVPMSMASMASPSGMRPLPFPTAPPSRPSLPQMAEPDTDDPTAPHARTDLPLGVVAHSQHGTEPPPSGIRRAGPGQSVERPAIAPRPREGSNGTRKASRRGIPLR